MTTTNRKKTSYQDAGVNIERGNLLVERIKKIAARTHGPAVMGGLGGFGALYDLSCLTYKNPVLVSGTDGVGTKVKIAIEMDKHDTIGIDLVAMCVNDLLTQGAKPLFFLDYYACATLDVDIASHVIEGIAQGCRLAGCSLTGGETAEMPGMYTPGDYDLAGFCVGVVERDKIIDGSKVRPGNVLIGIASTGPHANGYSLIRQILKHTDTHFDDKLNGKTMGDILLEPTRIYVSSVQQLIDKVPVNALIHITGGGLIENIPRVMPTDCQTVIDTNSWQWPSIFNWLQEQGNIDTDEMYRTFNCGVGMVVCLDKADQDQALECLMKSGEAAWVIGNIQQLAKGAETVKFLG